VRPTASARVDRLGQRQAEMDVAGEQLGLELRLSVAAHGA